MKLKLKINKYYLKSKIKTKTWTIRKRKMKLKRKLFWQQETEMLTKFIFETKILPLDILAYHWPEKLMIQIKARNTSFIIYYRLRLLCWKGYLTNSTGNSLSSAVACVSTKDVHSYARLRSANIKRRLHWWSHLHRSVQNKLQTKPSNWYIVCSTIVSFSLVHSHDLDVYSCLTIQCSLYDDVSFYWLLIITADTCYTVNFKRGLHVCCYYCYIGEYC